MTKKFTLTLILIIAFLVFSPLLFLYFFQDDFFLLTISNADTLRDFLRFFIPASGVVWYRPLSSQIFFFILKSLFGLNPFPYHLVMLITHLFNIYLMFLFAKEVSKNEKIALTASFVYGVSSVHFITLAWISTYSFILGPTFVLLTFLYYLKKNYKLSLVCFILGLLTSEVVIWTFFPLAVITVIYQKLPRKTVFLRLLPFLLAILVLILVRNVLFPVGYVEAYSIIINPLNVFILFKFYFFRTVGVPMLIRTMPNDLFKAFILFLGLATVFIPLFSLVYKKTRLKLLLLSVIIYISFLSFFLVLPNHYSPHYLTFAFLGIALFIGLTVTQFGKFIQVLLLVCYFTLQLITIKLTYDSHWVVKRADLAKKLVEEESFDHPVGSEEYISLGAGMAREIFKEK